MTRHKVYKLKLKGKPELVSILSRYVPGTAPKLAEARDLRRALRTVFGDDVKLMILSVDRPSIEKL